MKKALFLAIAIIICSSNSYAKNYDTVLARCYMNGCAWWRIEKQEIIKESEKGKLFKVSTKYGVQYYDKEDVRSDIPSKKTNWDKKTREQFIFCSEPLPTVIWYDEDQKKFIGTIPFDQDGMSSGATEGITNLYLHICNNDKERKFLLIQSPDEDIILDKPTDIFNYPMK